jgi:hypothetical protein
MTQTTSQLTLPIPLDYVETTIPPGMAIADYRRSRAPRNRRWRRLLRERG